jgi:hypothetical protein
VGEWLGQCVGLVIQWKRVLLRTLEGRLVSIGESSEGQNFSFPTLVVPEHEFEEGDTSISYDNGPHNTHGESGTAGSTSPLTEGSQYSTGNVPVVDDLPAERHSRRYSMQNRWRRARIPCERAFKRECEARECGGSKDEGGCKHNCLRDVDEKYILDQRYMAWG